MQQLNVQVQSPFRYSKDFGRYLMDVCDHPLHSLVLEITICLCYIDFIFLFFLFVLFFNLFCFVFY